jgi:hypothetical protein
VIVTALVYGVIGVMVSILILGMEVALAPQEDGKAPEAPKGSPLRWAFLIALFILIWPITLATWLYAAYHRRSLREHLRLRAEARQVRAAARFLAMCEETGLPFRTEWKACTSPLTGGAYRCSYVTRLDDVEPDSCLVDQADTHVMAATSDGMHFAVWRVSTSLGIDPEHPDHSFASKEAAVEFVQRDIGWTLLNHPRNDVSRQTTETLIRIQRKERGPMDLRFQWYRDEEASCPDFNPVVTMRPPSCPGDGHYLCVTACKHYTPSTESSDGH